MLPLAEGIAHTAGGASKVRRLTLLEQLGRSADSSATRDLITNSNTYDVTKGSFRSEFLELTDAGRKAVDPDRSPAERAAARFALAIEGVEPSRLLFERLVHERLPTAEVLRDMLIEAGIDADFAQEAAELFVVNAKDVGVLRLIFGAERVIPLEQVLEELPASSSQRSRPRQDPEVEPQLGGSSTTNVSRLPAPAEGLERTCFFVAPIGAAESEERHALGKPAVLVSRDADQIPFDIADLRIVRMDMSGI